MSLPFSSRLILLAVPALAANLLAQVQGPSPTNPPDGLGRDAGRNSPFSDQARALFLSGKVLQENGAPPPDRVAIERVCLGQPITEAYTDVKGNFSFELGRRNGVGFDASTSNAADTQSTMVGAGASDRSTSAISNQAGTITERDLLSCEIRAVLPGYSSMPVQLGSRRSLDKPDIGTIVLRPLVGVSGFTFSATGAMAPKEAKKAYDRGFEHLGKKRFADAQAEMQKAVALYPKYAAAWYALGTAQTAQADTAGATVSFTKASEADEYFVSPHIELMQIYGKQSKWMELEHETARVIQLNSVQFPVAFYLNAVANYNLKAYDPAEKSAREAVRLDTEHRIPRSEFLLGSLLVRKNENAEAAQVLRSYAARVTGADLEIANKQLAEVEARLKN